MHAPLLIGALLLFCSPLAAQAGQGRTPAPLRTYSVRGEVRDAENHERLERVSVELRSEIGGTFGTTFTRESGDFEFLNVPQGHYEIIAQQGGYHTVTQQLDVHGSVLGLSLDLPPNSSAIAPTPGPSSVSARELAIPRRARDAMAKGVALLYEKSKYQGSVKQFERALQNYPEYYEAYTQIGIANLRMGNGPNAEQALRKALELSGGQDVDALSWLATLLNDRRSFVDAEPLARKAVELDSNSWQANAELARSLLGLNRPVEAEKSGLAASKLQPDNALSYLVLANIHSQLENASALLEDLSNYLRLVPTGPIADKARAQQERLSEELRNASQVALPPTARPDSTPSTKVAEADTPRAAVSTFEDSPALISEKPVLWPPVSVDADLSPVAPGVSCPAEDVLRGVRYHAQELLESVDRFSATEAVDSFEIGKDGRASRTLKYTFDYLAAASLSRDGDLRFDESREQIGKFNSTPIPIRTVGLAVGAAVFHPLRFEDFETTCEGLGQWHTKPAWQLHFEQRRDKPSRFQAVFADGNWFDVRLKGRVWISPETLQIEHIDFDLLDPIPQIRLQTEHMSIDYGAVDFPKGKLQLWLPQSVSFYIDIGGHRFLNRHQLSNYLLFAVNATQIKAPQEAN